MHAFLEITRPFNCLMAGIATFIGSSVALGSMAFNSQTFYAIIAVMLVCAGGQTINDYFDRRVDKKLSPKKPIPSGRISPFAALGYALVLFVLGIWVASLIHFTAWLIALGFSVLLFAYSAFMTRVKYLGNIVVALGTAFTFIFGASVVGNYYLVGIFAGMAFLANWAREIAKDLADMKEDKGYKRTLPLMAGERFGVNAVYVLTMATMALAYYPFLAGLTHWIYVVLATLANWGFYWSLVQLRKKHYAISHNASKKSMAFALIAFLSTLIGR
ncbi:MAG: geranylgeranylglycerol-phosphate geranylgeranyltransferase [Candidatus Diapherotrites archaeon]|nr:geranylgeranylglycerol-phosphate geranylgeranyltransferase [Candidatus Diapherotrites archaeon]